MVPSIARRAAEGPPIRTTPDRILPTTASSERLTRGKRVNPRSTFGSRQFSQDFRVSVSNFRLRAVSSQFLIDSYHPHDLRMSDPAFTGTSAGPQLLMVSHPNSSSFPRAERRLLNLDGSRLGPSAKMAFRERVARPGFEIAWSANEIDSGT